MQIGKMIEKDGESEQIKIIKQKINQQRANAQQCVQSIYKNKKSFDSKEFASIVSGIPICWEIRNQLPATLRQPAPSAPPFPYVGCTSTAAVIKGASNYNGLPIATVVEDSKGFFQSSADSNKSQAQLKLGKSDPNQYNSRFQRLIATPVPSAPPRQFVFGEEVHASISQIEAQCKDELERPLGMVKQKLMQRTMHKHQQKVYTIHESFGKKENVAKKKYKE